MRELHVDLDEITMAMEDGSRDMNDYYLDTRSGELEVLPVELIDRMGGLGQLDDEDLLEWERDYLPKVEAVIKEELDEEGYPRYLWVPQVESWEGYDLMVRFAQSVEDGELRRLLAVALDGRGAFRRFKNVLYDYPDERESWFRFKDRVLREQAVEWLRSVGIEPKARPPVEAADAE